MARKRKDIREGWLQARSRPPMPVVVIAALAALGLAGVIVLLSWRASPSGPIAWASLGTQDAHSLAFVNDDPQHVLFGHHDGVLESTDGGRTWSPLDVPDDAMSMAPATDGSIVVAGHDVFTASRDGGATWAPISADLPSLDIHGLARDPGDPATMWAALATGGLWRSSDFGATWRQVRNDNVFYPTAVGDASGTALLAVDATGLIESVDGGVTWATLGAPPTYPMTSLAATPDGRTIFAGAPDGLFRSDDGGQTWASSGYRGSAFAAATTSDGQSVAVVSREAAFYRSLDRGRSWPGP